MSGLQPFAAELLELVARLADCFEPPRVRALIMPPVSESSGKHAEFCALELEDGSLGLAYASLGDTLRALARDLPGTTVAGLASTDVAGWFRSTDTVRRMLAFAAINNKDKVGLILFSDHVERYVPPAKGKTHVLRLIRELLTFRPSGRGTDLDAPLQLLGRVLKRRATVFLVSDFWASGFEDSLRTVARRHDCIAVRLRDPRETDLPAAGLVRWRDAETGRAVVVDTSAEAVRRQLRERAARFDRDLERTLHAAGVDIVDIDATASYVEPLQRFFALRAGRLRGGRR